MALDPRIIDGVLLVMLIEAGALWVAAGRRWLVLARRDVLLMLLPGALLLGAVRAALTPGAGVWVLLLIAASLPAHLADVAVRRQRARLFRAEGLAPGGAAD